MNLIDLDDTSGFEITLPDQEEVFGDIDTLRRELQEQIDLKSKREKEKESDVIRVLIERDGLIRQLATLKALAPENNKPSIEGPVLREILDKKSENVIREKVKSNMDNQRLVDLSQPSIQVPKFDLDKGKQNISSVKIDDRKSSTIPNLSLKLSQIDIELEKTKIENETLAKELKRVEMEASNVEMKRKIDFLKLSTLNSASFIAGPSKTQAIFGTTPNVIMNVPAQNVQDTQNTRIPIIGHKS